MAIITNERLLPKPAVVSFDASATPGVYGAATPEALQAAVGAAPIPEPPPEKPGIWDRMAGIFTRRKADAKARYLELLRKAEVDRRELSGKEIESLADAMDKAGITEADAGEHRRLIAKYQSAKATAAGLDKANRAMRAALDVIATCVEVACNSLAARSAVICGQDFHPYFDFLRIMGLDYCVGFALAQRATVREFGDFIPFGTDSDTNEAVRRATAGPEAVLGQFNLSLNHARRKLVQVLARFVIVEIGEYIL